MTLFDEWAARRTYREATADELDDAVRYCIRSAHTTDRGGWHVYVLLRHIAAKGGVYEADAQPERRQ
jgi:hypothetical protein